MVITCDTMDDLPSELLDLIVSHCDHPSQKSLRSVNHSLLEIATPPVFERFYIAPCTYDSSFRNLENIIRSKSKLARHIRRVIFYADILPPWGPNAFKTQLREKYGPAVVEHMDLGSAWDAFKTLQTREREFFEDNEDHLRVLKELLSSLPNLTSATSGVALPFQGPIARWPIWNRLFRDICISPDDWMFNFECGYDLDDERTWQTMLVTLNLLEAIGFRSSFAGLTQVRESKIQILGSCRWKTLMAGYTCDDIAMSYSVESTCRFETVLAAFAYVTDLELQIPMPAINDDLREISHAERDKLLRLNGAEVTTVLSRAQCLQRLQLEYDSESAAFWEPGEEDLHPLYPLLDAPQNPWPHLTHLRLSVNVPYTLLLSFLALLTPSLRSLDLRDMGVYDARKLFAQLPAVLPKLEKIYFECIWTKTNERYASVHAPPSSCILCSGLDVDEPYERELKAYLLGRADNFPKLVDDQFLVDGERADDDMVEVLETLAD